VSTTGGRAIPRRFAVALAAVPLVAVTIADATLFARARNEIDPHPGLTGQPHPTATSTAQAAQAIEDAARTAQIRQLLDRRGTAVKTHDRKLWLSTVDPRAKKFRAEQARTFDNMRQVPFRSWSYTFAPDREQFIDPHGHFHGETWSPSSFTLHYRLRAFDKRPTSLPQYPTFVRRKGQWLLASLTGFDHAGMHSSRDIWEFGPVSVVHDGNVLVLSHPASSYTAQTAATEVRADIPRVSAMWGHDWAERAVVLVPDTQKELGRVVDDFGDLHRIAAVATAEVRLGRGKPDPVGDRIAINPANWSQLSPLGRRIVLTHELTHVATRTVTSAATPSWLAEGFADYVGYLGSGVPTGFIASDLAHDVASGHTPKQLPSDHDFNGANHDLSQAYEGGWMACRLIVQRWGQAGLVRFYRAVGQSNLDAAAAVATALDELFRESARKFVVQWRGFLRTELS
jgi:hypothetical protein